ncbi:hypothetical protein AB0L00_36890 [Actinoallomurus sp. NPDC052308]|uniref:hypothetical protein n=1 Tax=Actinoallomurus sp. NPDC052308 TaxID=3155530 RepID=UPI00343C9F9A
MRSRVIGAVIGGVGAVLVVAVLLGNQWVVDAILRHDGFTNEKIGPVVRFLTFPSLRVSPLRAATLLPADVGTLVLVVVTALLIVPAVRSFAPRAGGPGRAPVPAGAGGEVRGGAFGAIVCGWWATIVAGALAGLIRGVLFNASEPLPGTVAWQFTWSNLTAGLGYGLFLGWLTGLGVLIGLNLGRRTPAPPGGLSAPYAPPQPGRGAFPPPAPYPGFGEVPATPPPTARPLPPGAGPAQALPPPPYAPGPPPGQDPWWTTADPPAPPEPGPSTGPSATPGRPADPSAPPQQGKGAEPPERSAPGRSEDRTLDPEPWRREPGSDPS